MWIIAGLVAMFAVACSTDFAPQPCTVDSDCATAENAARSLIDVQIQGDGTFKNLYFWSQGIPIQFFE